MTPNQKAIIHFCDVRNMNAAIYGATPLSTAFITEAFRVLNSGEACTLQDLKARFPKDATAKSEGVYD